MRINPKLVLFAILLLAVFFRFWQLDQTPPGLYPDEAINANDVLARPGQVFYANNNGREGFFLNLQWLSLTAFGPTIWALRFVPAVLGVLTVLGIYLLAKELIISFSLPARYQHLPMVSAFLLAISFWHVNFSRIGFRAIMLPLVLVFGFYCLFRALRQLKSLWFVLAGLIFGLGLYTYISYRLTILLLLFLFFAYLLIYKKEQKLTAYLTGALWLVAAAVIIALPILIYFIQQPENFIARAGGVSVFAQVDPLLAFAKSLVIHLGMFNVFGDPNWRHNISGSPMLFWPVGVLFLIGLLLSIRELARALRAKLGLSRVIILNSFLLLWLVVMLLPGALTYEGLPHGLRVIGVIPALYLLAALGGLWLYQVLARYASRKLLMAGLIMALLALVFGQYDRYFNQWAKSADVRAAFTQNFVRQGQYLNGLPADTQKYVIVNESGVPVPLPNGIPMPAQTLMFIERAVPASQRATYLKPNQLDQLIVTGPTIILPMKQDPDIFVQLYGAVPQGKLKYTNQFFVFEVE